MSNNYLANSSLLNIPLWSVSRLKYWPKEFIIKLSATLAKYHETTSGESIRLLLSYYSKISAYNIYSISHQKVQFFVVHNYYFEDNSYWLCQLQAKLSRSQNAGTYDSVNVNVFFAVLRIDRYTVTLLYVVRWWQNIIIWFMGIITYCRQNIP